MTMFSGGVNHPDHIHNTNTNTNNNNNNNSSSSSYSYAFDGGSCFFHPINHHRLINYQVLQQKWYENFNHNSCFTTTPPPPPHHHHNQAAASADCSLAGSSSSSCDPPPPCNHNHNYNNSIELIVVDCPMADIHQEDKSRTETDSTNVNEELGTPAFAGTSTSKVSDHIQIMHVGDDDGGGGGGGDHRHKTKGIQEEGGGGWLQLSIGSCSHAVDQNDQAAAGLEHQVLPRRRRRRSITWGDIEEEEEDHHHHHHQILELDLLSPGQAYQPTEGMLHNPQPPISIRRSSSTLSLAPPSNSQADFPPVPSSSSSSAVLITTSSPPNNLFLQQQYHPGLMGTNHYSDSAPLISFPPHFQDPWALRSTSSKNNIIIKPTNNNNINIASSSLMPPPHVSYFSNRPSFQLLQGHGHDISATSTTSGFRVVDPPRRPHSGVWFMLQAALIQSKEPFLPQIPKSYLRIKDGRMTVQFIIKYLVDKLRLDSETEIEIRCRGQQLLPFLTLKHVRDNVWMMSPSSTSIGPSPIDTTRLTSTSDHLMVLHYGRLS